MYVCDCFFHKLCCYISFLSILCTKNMTFGVNVGNERS
nr:MAG TPA: hypothetical protein [Caudoviricetes sp.]